MPSIMERYVQGLLFGEQLKGSQRKRRWEDLRQQVYAEQLEDIRQGRKAKQKLFALLEDPSSGKGELAPFVKAGVPFSTAADITGYTSPEERRKIAGEYTSVGPETITDLGLSLKSFMPQATITPTGTTVPIKGTPLDISKELRLRTPEEKEAPSPLKPTATARNLAAKEKRHKEWYMEQPPHYGLVPEEEIEGAWADREFGEEEGRPWTPELEQKYQAYLERKKVQEVEFSRKKWQAEVEPYELPEVELTSTLIKELGDFESFEAWYDSLPEDAQAELEAESETLKAVKNWYAVSR